MNTIMDFITDKIDTTTSEVDSSASSNYSTKNVEALLWDNALVYKAQQHIWRYKILNNPLPSWYALGARADSTGGNIKPDGVARTITFSLYDTPVRYDIASDTDNSYRARHEEGNLFSYPSSIDDVDGYNDKGELAEREWVSWSKGKDSSKEIGFMQEKINSVEYTETSTPSELSKIWSGLESFVDDAVDSVSGFFDDAVDAVGGFFSDVGDWFSDVFSSSVPENKFSAADITGLFGGSDIPDTTSHGETFTKQFSTEEKIKLGLYGRSTVPGEEAAYNIMSMPFVAREGTLKVAHAVELATNVSAARLWGYRSRYRQYPDPSLVLPRKFYRDGTSLKASTNNSSAMEMRRVRFYMPQLGHFSTNDLIAGLTYEIQIPIYNASFLAAKNFDVKLSYAKEGDYVRDSAVFNTEEPHKTMGLLKEIQTNHNVSLNGWGNNRGWVSFTWTVPTNTAELDTGNYLFFVQIDPNKALAEVHESRLDYNTGEILDAGGNNEGYFKFSATSVSDVQKKLKSTKSSALRASSVKSLSPRGTIYRVAAGGTSRAGEVFSAAEDTGAITANASFGNASGLGMNELFDVFNKGYTDTSSGRQGGAETIQASEDITYPVTITIDYNGDVFYPEAYLCGYNYKAGTKEVDHGFLHYKIALIPHSSTTVTINLTKNLMDYENGTGFEIVVPEVAAASVLEEIANSVQITPKTSTGDDTGSDTGSGTGSDTQESSASVGGSGGGCDMFEGSFVLLGLAGLAVLRLKKSR